MVRGDLTALSVATTVVIGLLGFAVIPGMQARVLAAASGAPRLAMAVNASGYQIAAGGAGLLGGMIADSDAGPRAIYLVAAGLTVCGLVLALGTLRPTPSRRQPEPRTART